MENFELEERVKELEQQLSKLQAKGRDSVRLSDVTMTARLRNIIEFHYPEAVTVADLGKHSRIWYANIRHSGRRCMEDLDRIMETFGVKYADFE